MPQPKPQLIPFPAAGLHEDAGFDNQPPLTTNLIENVRAHDSIKGRIRGGRRPALSKFHSAAINGSNAIQNILKVTRPVNYPDILGPYIVAFHGTGPTKFSGALDTKGNITFQYDTGDGAYGIARDANGDYYICGIRSTTWTGNDGSAKTVWKVSASGVVLWTFDTGSSGQLFDLLYDSVNDRIYVVGTLNSSASLWRLNPETGAQVWTVNLGLQIMKAAVDSNGNIFAVGFRNNVWTGATKQANVWKVNSSGTILAAYDTGGFEQVETLDINSSNQIFVAQDNTTTDWEGNDGSAKKIFLLDNNLSNSVIFTANPASVFEVLNIRSMANGSYVISCGTTNGEKTRKYDSTGALLWKFKASAQGTLDQLAVTSDDNVLIMVTQNSVWDGSTGTASLFLLNGSTGAVLENHIGGHPNASPFRNTDIHALSETIDPVSTRESSLIIVSGGTVKKLLKTTLTTPTGGSSILTDQPFRINAAQLFQNIFYVDGAVSKYYDLAADEVKDWATDVTKGTLPAKCRLIARYKGRVMIAGQQADPSNWFMPKVGDPFDFDFTPANPTAIQAVAGNASEVGLVGDVVTALMSFNDDAILIGGDKSLWQMSGDPAAGGSIDLITDQIGVAWNAWTQGPHGEIYFLGIDGVYRIIPRELPTKITSNRLDERFKSINLAGIRCLMAWDILRQGLVIVLAVPQTSVQTAYFWDSRVDAWTVDTYPLEFGPSFLYAYDSERVDDNEFLLGCKDSFIRQADNDAADDDGTAINSKVRYKPIALTDGRSDGVLQGVAVTLAVGSGAVTLKVYTGQTAEECVNSTTSRYTRTLNAGRNSRAGQNIRGRYVQIELSSTVSARWAVESVFLTIRPSGGGRDSRG